MVWNNPKMVEYTPFVTVLIFETGKISQFLRVLFERSAAGQSMIGWALSILGLMLWYNFYRVLSPERLIAKRSTLVGMTMNVAMLAIIAYFRYFYGG